MAQRIRYSLTLSPATLPPEVAEELLRARSGRPDGRERLIGYIKDKIDLRIAGGGASRVRIGVRSRAATWRP